MGGPLATYSARRQCPCTVEGTCRRRCFDRRNPRHCTRSWCDGLHSPRPGNQTRRSPMDTHGLHSLHLATQAHRSTCSLAPPSTCHDHCTTVLQDTTPGCATCSRSRLDSQTCFPAPHCHCCWCTRGSTRTCRASGRRIGRVQSTQRSLLSHRWTQGSGRRDRHRTTRRQTQGPAWRHPRPPWAS